MTPRTLAPPLTDRAMWRRLRALAHPDRAGDHAIYIWVEAWLVLELELALLGMDRGEG